MQAKQSDLKRYRGRYDAGYETIRLQRFERQKKLGVIAGDTALSPMYESWPEDVESRAWLSGAMETYAAQIDCMDQGVGRLLAALDVTDQRKNTLVLFMHDNGGSAELISRAADAAVLGAQPIAPIPWEAIRIEARPFSTRDGRKIRYGREGPPGEIDSYMMYGAGWAQVSNTLFRGFKAWQHEGGIATPLLVNWPAGIAYDQEGRLRTDPGHLVDIMATVLDVTGIKYPAVLAGQPTRPPEGISLLPAFTGERLPVDRPIYFEHLGSRGLHQGDWKLVAYRATGPWELYNLAQDRSELHDQAGQESTRLNEMVAIWETWARRADVLPWVVSPSYQTKNP